MEHRLARLSHPIDILIERNAANKFRPALHRPLRDEQKAHGMALSFRFRDYQTSDKLARFLLLGPTRGLAVRCRAPIA